MTREEFWALVEQSLREARTVEAPRRGLLRRRADLRPGRRHVLATEGLLARLADEELVSFQEHLDALRDDACTWDVFGAGQLACGGLGEDGFTDLRTWLVSQGRAAHARVLAEPDALVDVVPPDLDARLEDAETWGYVALELWDARRDDDMPRPAFGSGALRGDLVTDPAGRYPRLWARYAA